MQKSYEFKYDIKNDNFILNCAESALKNDSLNLNAMLLKAEVLEQRIINKTKTIAQLQNDNQFKEYEKLIASLYKLGYREIPIEIKNLIISRISKDVHAPIFIKDQTPNPFKHINSDPKDTRYATLSWGLFDEIHETKPYEKYGRTLFDTKKQKINKFSPADTLYNNYNFDPVVFAWNVDPLASERVEWSPYNAFRCNPILNVDPNGALDTDFKDKEGNLISHIDDGSNAVFQLKGTDHTNEYFKFKEFSDQGGKDEVSIEGAITGAQDHVMNNYINCNQAVNFVGRSYKSAVNETGSSVAGIENVNGNKLANEISSGLAASAIQKEVTIVSINDAKISAASGNLVVGTALVLRQFNFKTSQVSKTCEVWIKKLFSMFHF